MLKVSAYKRPAELEDALVALDHGRSVLVRESTRLSSSTGRDLGSSTGRDPTIVVDLQAVGLAGVASAVRTPSSTPPGWPLTTLFTPERVWRALRQPEAGAK